MIPQFALILSFSGLTLLQRVASGWEVVGDVALDAADMSGELAALRTRAMVRADCDIGEFTTKLVLPDEQVRYMTLPAEQNSVDAVRKALTGATPYHVDDLVFDFDTDAAGTHVAAVARETLDEAEAFAIEHGFAPVSFVASPRDGRFDREVFFGMTAGAVGLLPAGMVLSADDKPLAIYRTEDDASPTFITRRTGDEVSAEDMPPTPDDPAIDPDLPMDEAAPEDAATSPKQPSEDGEKTAPALDEATATEPTPPAKDVPPKDAAPKGSTPTDQTTGDTPGELVFRSAHHPKVKAPEVKAPSPKKAPTSPKSAKTEAPATGGAERLAKVMAAKAAAAKSASAAAADDALSPGAAEFTTFQGAQQSNNRGLWLALAALLFVVVAGAGVWALTSDGISRFFGSDTADITPEILPPAEPTPAAPAPVSDTPPPVEVAPEPTPEPEHAVTPAPTSDPVILTPEEARRIYAATGVWQRAPRSQPLGDDNGAAPAAPQAEDAAPAPVDPVALGTGESSLFSAPPEAPPVPPASNALFDLDELGLVRPTPEGAISPVGVLVFAGLPDKTPPPRSSDTPADAPLWSGLVRRQDMVRPKGRPEGFAPVVTEPTAAEPAAAPETPTPVAPAAEAPETEAPAADVPAQDATPPEDTPAPDQDAAVTPAPQPAIQQAEAAARLAFLGNIRPMARPGSETEPTPQTTEATPAMTAPVLAEPIQVIAAAPAVRPLARSPSLALVQPALVVAPTPPPVMPKARPAGLVPNQQEQAVAVALAQVGPASPYAVISSMRPKTRPGNFSRVVAAAAAPRAQAQVAPRTVAPTGRSNNTVAARATEQNAINLGRTNLIGVYGTRSDRRALVRLSNGRFVKVGVGDRLDGGRVSSIGADDLRYSKGGRTVRLRMPSG